MASFYFGQDSYAVDDVTRKIIRSAGVQELKAIGSVVGALVLYACSGLTMMRRALK